MSTETLADTVDFQGPGALPFARVPQIRYTYDGFDDLSLSLSAEEDVSNSDDYAYTVAARYGFDRGMVRVAGLWRDATIAGAQVDGWGLNLSGVMSFWPGGTIKANLATGKGISDILAVGLTGNALFMNGSAAGVNAAATSVTHQVSPKLLVAATHSWVGVDQASGIDTKKVESIHLSAFYEVRKNTTLMAEFFAGRRTQGDGTKFNSNRVQLAVKFAF